MRWHRRKNRTVIPDLEKSEARQALTKARNDLAHTQRRSQEIASEVRKAKRHRRENNFAEIIRQALGGT